MRGFERFLEVFREVFRGFSKTLSETPSQSAIFLSELRVVLPLIVLPLKTPAIGVLINSVLHLDWPFPPCASASVIGCGLFAYNESFLLTVELFYLQLTILAFFLLQLELKVLDYNFSLFTYSWSFSAYSGKVRLIRALRGCKRRSLTVRKKAPTASKETSPVF